MNDRGQVGRAIALSAAVVVAGLFGGCGTTTSSDGAVGQANVAPSAAAAGQIAVRVVDRPGYESVLAERRGKVVLVDFWATWCPPCIEQFPHTVELAERYGQQGLAVVTVSCDEPADAQRVEAFLRAKNASGVTNLISQYGGSPRTMEAFEIETGAVPFYKLYDRTGRLRRTFGINPRAKTQFASPDIDAAIEQLLAE